MSATLEATVNDLAPAGNYFTDGLYLEARLESGTLRNRGGVRLMALPDDLLVGVSNALEEIAGPDATSIQFGVGRRWGQRAAALFAQEIQQFYGKPLAELPLGVALTAIRAAFASHGWGELQIDPSRYAQGVLGISIASPVLGADVRDAGQKVEHLTAGFLAGFFSNWAGVELGCLQSGGPSVGKLSSTFVLTLPKRLDAVAELAAAGRSHDEIVAKLGQIQAA